MQMLQREFYFFLSEAIRDVQIRNQDNTLKRTFERSRYRTFTERNELKLIDPLEFLR